MGTHQGAVSLEHLDYYLDEFTFRFNRPSAIAFLPAALIFRRRFFGDSGAGVIPVEAPVCIARSSATRRRRT
jgi:hypothetical protein